MYYMNVLSSHTLHSSGGLRESYGDVLCFINTKLVTVFYRFYLRHTCHGDEIPPWTRGLKFMFAEVSQNTS